MVWSTARAAKPLTATVASAASASSSRRLPRATASMSSSAVSGSSSNLTIRTVAAFSRNLLRFGCRKITVRGLERFLSHLHSSSRLSSNTGLLTYCNHISVLDEPTIWGSLPASSFRNADTVRWTLGASDIMFTSSLLSKFFRSGQCIETHRGGGIHQAAIDDSISKLDAGKWIHLFPEGYVNVSTSTRLRRFKWGISRMLIEAEKMPVVVPIWITGFDKLMPEPRDKPKWLPRWGADVTIDFGEPISDTIGPIIKAIKETGEAAPQHLLPHELCQSETDAEPLAGEENDRSIPTQVATTWSTSNLIRSHADLKGNSASLKLALARSQLAAVLRHHLGLVGVDQRRADGFPHPEQDGELVHTQSLRSAEKHAQNNVLRDGERKKVGV